MSKNQRKDRNMSKKSEKEYEKRLRKRFLKFCKDNPTLSERQQINDFCEVEKNRNKEKINNKKIAEKEAAAKRAMKHRSKALEMKETSYYVYGKKNKEVREVSQSVWTFSGGRCNPR